MTSSRYREQSFWHDTLPGPIEPRPPLAEDTDVDIAIVGAGFTGLWTAYYLKTLDPGLRVAVVEAEIAGFGASGRNGGWCMGALTGMHGLQQADPEGAARLQRALIDTVDEVARVCRQESIDCHWQKAGTVSVATSEPFRSQLQAQVDHWRQLQVGEEELRWLEPAECAELVRTATNLGGLFLAPVAALHPALLVRGLADAVERKGVSIYESCPAERLDKADVVTAGGRLRADIVVRATEGYTPTIKGQQRVLLPVHSMMIATEPLPQAVWDEIGFADRVTFGDARRMVTYGQRTLDDRMAFGCRGAYFYGSGVRNRFSPDDRIFEQVQRVLEGFFPVLRGHRITHRWGGTLAVPRSWKPTVGLDRPAGLAWAGGYAGEGVGAANLAARTLADLILERDTDRTSLPLVGPRFRRWEPEPLRWLAYSMLVRFGSGMDDANLAGRPTPRLRGAIYNHFVRK